MSAFADSRPEATLLQLAAELGEDVAAIQLEGLLHAEAERNGNLDWFARDLLARCIRDQLPMGWNASEQFALERAGVFASWSAGVRGFLDKSTRKMIWEAIKHADIPAGWLPEGPDDPIIELAFAGAQSGADRG